MKTNKSLRTMSLFVVVICVLFANCDNEGLIPADVTHELAPRSCQTVTQAWVNQIKSLAAAEYSVPPSALDVSAVELITASTYEFHSKSELVGTEVENIDAFLLLVTHDGNIEDDIVAYYNPSTLSFCVSPIESYVIVGKLDDITLSTLGIIGSDQESY